MAKQLRTLTVRQLIDRLEDENPDALVVVGADYGDYHHTEQALPLSGDIESVTISKSAYSSSGFAIAEPDEDDDKDDDQATYVVLR